MIRDELLCQLSYEPGFGVTIALIDSAPVASVLMLGIYRVHCAGKALREEIRQDLVTNRSRRARRSDDGDRPRSEKA